MCGTRRRSIRPRSTSHTASSVRRLNVIKHLPRLEPSPLEIGLGQGDQPRVSIHECHQGLHACPAPMLSGSAIVWPCVTASIWASSMTQPFADERPPPAAGGSPPRWSPPKASRGSIACSSVNGPIRVRSSVSHLASAAERLAQVASNRTDVRTLRAVDLELQERPRITDHLDAVDLHQSRGAVSTVCARAGQVVRAPPLDFHRRVLRRRLHDLPDAAVARASCTSSIGGRPRRFLRRRSSQGRRAYRCEPRAG